MKKILTTNNRRSLVSIAKLIPLLVALFGASTGCTKTVGTNYRTPPASVNKGAVLDALPIPKDRDRIKKAIIVSVNGQSVGTEEARLRPGSNQVRVRFTWPNSDGLAQVVGLSFQARKNQRYYIKYISYPHVHASDTMGNVLGSIGDIAVSDPCGYGVIPAVALSPVILGGAYTGRAIKNSKTPTHIDIFVISEDRLSEGVVRYVRVFADGRVELRKWD